MTSFQYRNILPLAQYPLWAKKLNSEGLASLWMPVLSWSVRKVTPGVSFTTGLKIFSAKQIKGKFVVEFNTYSR